MSNRAINWAKTQKTGGPGAKCILLLLADRAGEKTNECHPGHDLLAAEAELSDRQVRTHLKTLEGLGLVTIKLRYVEGRRSSNKYTLAVPDDFEPPTYRKPASGSDTDYRNSTSSSEDDYRKYSVATTGSTASLLPEAGFRVTQKEPKEEPTPPYPPQAPTAPTRPTAGEGESDHNQDAMHGPLAELLAALPARLRPGGADLPKFAEQAAPFLAGGWTLAELAAELSREAPENVYSRGGFLKKRLGQLDADRPTRADGPFQPARVDRAYCPVHPGTLIADCGLCATERAAAYDPEDDDGPVDYQAVRAALRGRDGASHRAAVGAG